jgi:hypothetical protein
MKSSLALREAKSLAIRASKGLSEKTDVQEKGRILFKTRHFRESHALPT